MHFWIFCIRDVPTYLVLFVVVVVVVLVVVLLWKNSSCWEAGKCQCHLEFSSKTLIWWFERYGDSGDNRGWKQLEWWKLVSCVDFIMANDGYNPGYLSIWRYHWMPRKRFARTMVRLSLILQLLTASESTVKREGVAEVLFPIYCPYNIIQNVFSN